MKFDPPTDELSIARNMLHHQFKSYRNEAACRLKQVFPVLQSDKIDIYEENLGFKRKIERVVVEDEI